MKKLIPLFLFSLFITSVSSEEIEATDFQINQLSNEKLKVIISNTGKLLSVENFLSSEKYDFVSDQFELDTDIGILSNKDKKPNSIKKNNHSIVYQFDYGNVDLELVYTLKAENSFFRRLLKVVTKTPLRIKKLKLGEIKFSEPADEAIHYMTFWMAPTVEFIRFEKGGIFTGFENPFYHADLNEKGVALSFEPGLILKVDEGYESEPQFIGVYKKSGIIIEDSARPYRFINGSGHIPIDRNESRAMRAFALDYLAPVQKTFLNINEQFFHPLPQMPKNDNDKWYFIKAIDTFADIEGDMIGFKPLHPYKKPDSEIDYWNLLPEKENATARQIVEYAKKKGISYGFYMGVAAHGKEGNSAGLSFRPDRQSWKKVDVQGRRAPDNCIGDDEFYEWWFRVQDNTIKKYKLSNWSWDPSLGSAMNCYDEKHGHIAGKGAYKGWRRCIELTGRLKEKNPELYILGYYGTKNFGLWGLKHTDQHQVYNEQTAIVSSHHTQISDDRQNADGIRFQNYWSMRFRFLPAVLGNSYVHRMSEGVFDRELVKAWDFYGWQYSLLSSIAVSGSAMPAILPYESDLVPGYKQFYKKWTRWAKKNFQYIRYTEPFGEQVQQGSVDGYARIKGDHGFIFLFNGNPRPSEITFEVGDEINLQQEGNYEFVELYPSDEGKLVLDNQGKSVFALGQEASLTISANSCKLLELKRATKVTKPILVGISGHTRLIKNQLVITGVRGKPGHVYPIRVRLSEPASVKKVKVNGVRQDFSVTDSEVRLDVQFKGNAYTRELDHWIKPDGSIFEFPYHNKQESLKIKTKFKINKDVVQLLEKARPKNFAEMGEKIAAWQVSGKDAYSYHNFTCSRPERLWLIIPFTLQKVSDVKVSINSIDMGDLLMNDTPGHSFYMDITDLIGYGVDNEIELFMQEMDKNEFMGPFLMYPGEELTGDVLSKPKDINMQVIYKKSLISPGPPRYIKGANRPVITDARVMGNVTLKKSTQLRVKVNLSPENIQSVTYSHSGFPWMGKVGLRYNEDIRCWIANVEPGDRWRIQESEYIFIWAVSRDGLYSDFYPVKVGWDFK